MDKAETYPLGKPEASMRVLKLWMVYRDECGYDEFDAIIVAADTAEEAMATTPKRTGPFSDFGRDGWSQPPDQYVLSGRKVRQIGFALPGIPKGLIIASYNAG